MDRDTSYDVFNSSEDDPAPLTEAPPSPTPTTTTADDAKAVDEQQQRQQAEESNNLEASYGDDDFDEDSFEDEDDTADDRKTNLPSETPADVGPRKAADEANISRGRPSIDAAGEDDIDLSDTSAECEEDGAGQQSSNTARSPAAVQAKELATATPPAAIAAAASKSSPDTGITAQELRARNTRLRTQLKMFSASK